MEIFVPISLGELYDKISILLIKLEKITNISKIQNIKNELKILNDISKRHIIEKEFEKKLYSINFKLWDIEDKIRIKEKNKQFDNEFVEFARFVYFLNDERAQIKKQINEKYNSEIIEEKSHEKY